MAMPFLCAQTVATSIALVISTVALCVSVLSLVLSLHRTAVEHRTQWEEVRADVAIGLTSIVVELLAVLDKLLKYDDKEPSERTRKLVALMDSVVDLRNHIILQKAVFWFHASPMLPNFVRMKGTIGQVRMIVDQLQRAINDGNLDLVVLHMEQIQKSLPYLS